MKEVVATAKASRVRVRVSINTCPKLQSKRYAGGLDLHPRWGVGSIYALI